MHHAPSVSLPVGRSFWALRAALLAWLAGAGAFALGWATAEPSPVRLVGLATVLVGAGGWAAWSWHRSPAGDLRWEGGQWQWQWQSQSQSQSQSHGRLRPGAGEPPALLAAPEVVLDFQSVLLVRLRPAAAWPGPGVPASLWLERRAAGPGTAGDERWQSLRRAVHGRATDPGMPSRPDGAAALP